MIPELVSRLVPDATMETPTLLAPLTAMMPELVRVALPLVALVTIPTELPQAPPQTVGRLLAVPTTLTTPLLIVVALPVLVLVKMPVPLKAATLTVPLLTVVASPMFADVWMPTVPKAIPNKGRLSRGSVKIGACTVPLTTTLPEFVVVAFPIAKMPSLKPGEVAKLVAVVVTTPTPRNW